MNIITRQEEIDNRWLTWVDIGDNNCLLFETENQLTEEEAQVKLDAWQAAQIVEEPNVPAE